MPWISGRSLLTSYKTEEFQSTITIWKPIYARLPLAAKWIFAATPKGAHASATLYSLVETCKANGLDPLSYLTLIFTELPKIQDAAGYETLLPYRISDHFDIKPYNPSKPGVIVSS